MNIMYLIKRFFTLRLHYDYRKTLYYLYEKDDTDYRQSPYYNQEKNEV